MSYKDKWKAALIILSVAWLAGVLYLVTRDDPQEHSMQLSPSAVGSAVSSGATSATYSSPSFSTSHGSHAGVRSSVHARSSHVSPPPVRRSSFSSHLATPVMTAPVRTGSSIPVYTGMGTGGGMSAGGSTGGSSGASGRGIRTSGGGVSMPMLSVSSPIAMASMPVAAREVENGMTSDETYARIRRRVIIGGGDDDYDPDPVEDPLNPGRDPSDPFFTPVGDALLPLLLMAMAFALFTAARRKVKVER